MEKFDIEGDGIHMKEQSSFQQRYETEKSQHALSKHLRPGENDLAFWWIDWLAKKQTELER